jgi:hypothetical protein
VVGEDPHPLGVPTGGRRIVFEWLAGEGPVREFGVAPVEEGPGLGDLLEEFVDGSDRRRQVEGRSGEVAASRPLVDAPRGREASASGGVTIAFARSPRCPRARVSQRRSGPTPRENPSESVVGSPTEEEAAPASMLPARPIGTPTTIVVAVSP